MKPRACVRFWIYEDSPLAQHNKTLLIMYSDVSPQSSPGWTCIITICRNKGLTQRKRVLILRHCSSVSPICVCVCVHVLMWWGSTLSSLRAQPRVRKQWSYGAGRNNSVSGKRSALAAQLHQVRQKHGKRRKKQAKVVRAWRICFQ